MRTLHLLGAIHACIWESLAQEVWQGLDSWLERGPASQEQRGQLPGDERAVAGEAHAIATALLAADGVAARGRAPLPAPVEMELHACGRDITCLMVA